MPFIYDDFIPREVRSMPAAPDLSHYYGRTVKEIRLLSPSGEGDPVWEIVLDGDVVVQNYDPVMPVPGDHLVGQTFTNMTLHPNVTSMFFGGLGGHTVSLNPMKYAIADKRVMPDPYFAQVSEANPNWQPPPHPDERVADGPEEGWDEQ